MSAAPPAGFRSDSRATPRVVILAGGLGTRLREETEFRPKPMVEVGGKPIIWHIMKGFAHYGLDSFVVCAGYKGEMIKEYFLNYRARNNDFTVTLGEHENVAFHGTHDEAAWTVTVADTGERTMTGGRVYLVGPISRGRSSAPTATVSPTCRSTRCSPSTAATASSRRSPPFSRSAASG